MHYRCSIFSPFLCLPLLTSIKSSLLIQIRSHVVSTCFMARNSSYIFLTLKFWNYSYVGRQFVWHTTYLVHTSIITNAKILMGRPIITSLNEIRVFATGRFNVPLTGEMCSVFFQFNDKFWGNGIAPWIKAYAIIIWI